MPHVFVWLHSPAYGCSPLGKLQNPTVTTASTTNAMRRCGSCGSAVYRIHSVSQRPLETPTTNTGRYSCGGDNSTRRREGWWRRVEWGWVSR